MKINDLRFGTRIRYIPPHAYGDPQHPDCENGMVSHNDGRRTVYVKFDRDVQLHGREGSIAVPCEIERVELL